MATLGYVAPISQQSTEGFHALKRTIEGLLYYTKVNKDSTDSIDFDGGNPTDKNGNTQLPYKVRLHRRNNKITIWYTVFYRR